MWLHHASCLRLLQHACCLRHMYGTVATGWSRWRVSVRVLTFCNLISTQGVDRGLELTYISAKPAACDALELVGSAMGMETSQQLQCIVWCVETTCAESAHSTVSHDDPSRVFAYFINEVINTSSGSSGARSMQHSTAFSQLTPAAVQAV
jgi:hypothetical protein